MDKTFSEVFDHIEAALDCEFNVTLFPEENGVLVRGVKDLQARLSRALEAMEKLREVCEPFRNAFHEHGAYQYKDVTPEIAHITNQNVITPRGVTMGDFRRLYDALSATEPATVELPKRDHCGAIACGTDCDGSSHYTPEKKE